MHRNLSMHRQYHISRTTHISTRQHIHISFTSTSLHCSSNNMQPRTHPSAFPSHPLAHPSHDTPRTQQPSHTQRCRRSLQHRPLGLFCTSRYERSSNLRQAFPPPVHFVRSFSPALQSPTGMASAAYLALVLLYLPTLKPSDLHNTSAKRKLNEWE